MDHITASDMMARSETTLPPGMDIYDALRRLLKYKLTGAPVVDEDGVLLGMLTERDCLKVVVAGALGERAPAHLGLRHQRRLSVAHLGPGGPGDC